MESLTYFKNQKITPRKYREVVAIVRGMQPVQAMNILSKTNKKAAMSLAKILKSAIANATTTLKVSDDMLQFKLLTVEEGNRLKRYRAVSRGMARAFNRRMSHIKILLRTAEVKEQVAPVKNIEEEQKKTEKAKAQQGKKKKVVAKKAKVAKIENK